MIDVEARIRESDGGPSLDVRLGIDASAVHIFERGVELEVWPIEQITLESRQASSFLFDVNGSRWIIEPHDATRFVFQALPVLTRPQAGGWRKALRRLVGLRRLPAAFGWSRFFWSALTGLIWLAIFGLGIMVGRLRLDGQNTSTWMLLILIFAGGLTWALALGGGPESPIRRTQETDGDPSLLTPPPRRSGAPERTAPTSQGGVIQPKRWTVRGDPSVLARLLDERATQAPVRSGLRDSVPSSEAEGRLPGEPESLRDHGLEYLRRPDDTRDTEIIDSESARETPEPDVVASVSGRRTTDGSGDVPQPISPDETHDAAARRTVPAPTESPGSDRDADQDRPVEDHAEGGAHVDTQDDDFRAIPITVEVDGFDLHTDIAEASTSSPVDVVPLLHDTDEEDEGLRGGAAGDTPPRLPDDLKVLHGVGPVLESWLNDMGIWTFDDLLAVDEVAEESLRTEFGRFSARIFRDGWRDAVVEAKAQLEQLGDAPDTSSSVADAVRGD